MWCCMNCACVVVVVCASMCVYAVIVNSCDDACWIMCVIVLTRCLMRSRVVCDAVWLYGSLFVLVLLFVCAMFTCVNVMVVTCVDV